MIIGHRRKTERSALLINSTPDINGGQFPPGGFQRHPVSTGPRKGGYPRPQMPSVAHMPRGYTNLT